MPIKDKPEFDESKESIREILVDGKKKWRVEPLPKEEAKPMETRPQEQFKPEPTEKEKVVTLESEIKSMKEEIVSIKRKLGIVEGK